MRFRGLLAELKRRKVYRVAVVYIIGAVAGLELIDVLVPSSRLPDWSDELFLALAVAGFPLAVVLAWAFEVTPDGVRATRSAAAGDAPGSHLPAAALAALVLACVAVWWHFAGSPKSSAVRQTIAALSPAQPETRPFVAVLPLDNLSPDAENAFFADGIHEEVLTQLSKVAGLGVIARTTMNQYRQSTRSIATIGSELGVSAILQGSVRRAGDRVRISVQLIDPTTSNHLWSETYDRRLDDVFAVQAAIARSVVENLETTLTSAEERLVGKRPTESLAAYDLYLRGREARRRGDEDGNRDAVRYFEAALEIDANFAPAWGGLSDAWSDRDGRFGFAHGEPARQALGYARRAIEIDPEYAAGHNAMGRAYMRLGDLDAAHAAYENALTYDPNYYEAWLGISAREYTVGRYDECVRATRRATRLAPHEIAPAYLLAHCYKFLRFDEAAQELMQAVLSRDPQHHGMLLLKAQFEIYAGRPDEALRIAREMVENQNRNEETFTGSAAMAYMAHDYRQAIDWARMSGRISPGNTAAYWHETGVLLSLSLLQAGATSETAPEIGRALRSHLDRIEQGERRWSLLWDVASLYAAMGDAETALDWLERAHGQGFRFVRWLEVDPAFDALRTDGRFRRLVNQMESEIREMRNNVLSFTS